MTTESSPLPTSDDRLARIEDLLIKLSTRLDRMEQHLSNIRASMPQQRSPKVGE